LKTVPRKPDVFNGLLHDCDSTLAPDNSLEPKPDEDRWLQYCFKNNETLEKKRIFIEFMLLDWDEWFDDPEAKEKLERAWKEVFLDCIVERIVTRI
jgi:hypothetical protein